MRVWDPECLPGVHYFPLEIMTFLIPWMLLGPSGGSQWWQGMNAVISAERQLGSRDLELMHKEY